MNNDDLTLTEYQVQARKTAQYPESQALSYTILGLTNEAGEVAGKFKKYLRGDYGYMEMRNMVIAELGDVLWYVAMVAHAVDFDLQDIAQANLDKLSDRSARGKIKGDGDER
jgi:NTP pyrophosphatase (non-canonical NTP hydrolase)